MVFGTEGVGIRLACFFLLARTILWPILAFHPFPSLKMACFYRLLYHCRVVMWDTVYWY